MSKLNIRIAVIVLATVLSATGYAAAKGGGGGHGGVVTAVVVVGMVARISVVVAMLVGISGVARTSAVVGAT